MMREQIAPLDDEKPRRKFGGAQVGRRQAFRRV